MLYTGGSDKRSQKEMRMDRRKQAMQKIHRKIRSLDMLINDVFSESERRVLLNHLKREVEKMEVRKDK